jgi:hypothetical protein
MPELEAWCLGARMTSCSLLLTSQLVQAADGYVFRALDVAELTTLATTSQGAAQIVATCRPAGTWSAARPVDGAPNDWACPRGRQALAAAREFHQRTSGGCA